MLGPRIGVGSFGEVYKGEWRRTSVAVKKLFLDPDADGPAAVAEFRREVALMRRLKHPHIVQFLGCVARPPDLAIVTQLAAGGSLFKLLHRPAPPGGPPKPAFTPRLCGRMALDVARGMLYLHSCSPPIVHRDLKSPNLLVDAGGVIRVCDFGLSAARSGARTYLSARSRAGTPEWTAPEVLRSQGSNEKADIFSFGEREGREEREREGQESGGHQASAASVTCSFFSCTPPTHPALSVPLSLSLIAVVLWELFTQKEPWADLTSVQVVGQVGFGGARLPIPATVPPAIASLIEACWAEDPTARPDFEGIIDSLTAFLRADAAAARGGGRGGGGGGGGE